MKTKKIDKRFMHVVDRGADVTIFAFSTAFRRGKSQFEFLSLLNRVGKDFNLVFLRDISRTVYQLTPRGEPGGIAFHSTEVMKVKAELGASYNVGIGLSTGGNAALYLATQCNFNRVIAFGPMLKHDPYTSLRFRFYAVMNVKLLLREPMAYLEQLVLSIITGIFVKRMRHRVGEQYVETVFDFFAAAAKRPRTSIVYGRHCPPDVYHAGLLAQFPEVNTISLETGRHRSPIWLKKHGCLDDFMKAELRDAFQHLKSGSIVQQDARRVKSAQGETGFAKTVQ
jgi:hypothetical protein